MLKNIQEIQSLATKYSKQQLGRMVQMGVLDPQKAMMAGMMRDRIAKEDMQPPTSTVAQDTLGIPAVAQQMPPQMPPQGAPAGPPQMPPQGAPAAPPMMAASGGLTNLPADNVGNYAGGGIVAFAAGSKDPVKEDSGFMFPEGSLAGKFQRNLLPGQESAAARANKELQYIEQRLLDPNISAAERMRLEQGRAVLTQRTNESYPSEGLRGGATFTRPDSAPPTFTDARQAPAAAPEASSVEVPSASPKPASLPNIQRPTIDTSTFEDKVAKATPNLPTLDKTEAKDVATLGRERRAAYAAEGYNPEMFNEMIAGIEKKKGKMADEKDIAVGEAIMQAGLKLMGARKGQEFQALSEGAQEGLKTYQNAAKDLRARQERLDDRMETLRIADAQARRTGAESDITRRDKIAEQVQADNRAVYQAQSQAATQAVQAAVNMTNNDKTVMASMFATETAANTQLRIAQINAQTQREYTQAFKAQGLQDSQIKNIMGTASEIYKAALAKNPTADETQTWAAALQQAASGYASVAPMVGRTMPGPAPAAPKLGKDELKKMYNLQ
jgi:hypothetical protein